VNSVGDPDPSVWLSQTAGCEEPDYRAVEGRKSRRQRRRRAL